MANVFHVDHQIDKKDVKDSQTEWTKVLQYSDINCDNRLSGGRLMEWLGEMAETVAIRHSGNPVITVCVDNMQFKQGAKLGDIVVIIGKMTYVGNTSMEVRVDTYVEDRKTGLRHVINRAYLTEVCLDDDEKPLTIPYGLKIETECQKAEWEGALKRIAMRKKRRAEGF